MTTDTATPTVGKIEFASDYQSRQTVVPVADLEFTKARIERLERDLRECAELLDRMLEVAEVTVDTRLCSKGILRAMNDTRAMLARLKGTPNLSALQESDDGK